MIFFLIISSRNLMYPDLCLRKMLCFYFFLVKLVACWFFSSWNFYIDFLLSKLILFVELVEWWFLHVKFNLFWYFSNEFCSMLIYSSVKVSLYRHFSWWNLLHVCFFFVKHDACCFLFVKCVPCGLFSSLNLMYLDLCLWKMCYIFISFT